MRELSHRINNEFTSAISVISLQPDPAAVRSKPLSVTLAIAFIATPTFIGRCRCRNIKRMLMQLCTFSNYVFPSADHDWSRTT